MSVKLAQQRDACISMMEEVSDMLGADFSNQELQNCNRHMENISDRIAQQEYTVKNTIKELTGQIADTQLQTQHDADTHQKNMEMLQQKKSSALAHLQENTSAHTQNREILNDIRRKIVVADGRLRDIETNQTATVSELKHYISLYMTISNMVFDYDEVDNLAGYNVNQKEKKVKSFEWKDHHDDFGTANALWEFIGSK